jgi:hypothetical protein
MTKTALTLTATAVLGLSLTVLTSVGVARDAAASFACPNPKVLPLGKIYGKSRGTSFCNDGARATVLIAGKPKLTLVGGVCWRNTTSLEVGIGTLITNDPKKSDPAGLLLTDEKPADVVGDTLDLSKGTLGWTGPVKVKLTGKNKGTFAATPTAAKVNGKLTGSFTCKRILDAPDQ